MAAQAVVARRAPPSGRTVQQVAPFGMRSVADGPGALASYLAWGPSLLYSAVLTLLPAAAIAYKVALHRLCDNNSHGGAGWRDGP